MEFPRKVERRVGKLVSFDTKPGQSHARVRTSDGVTHLPTNARGKLQPDGGIVLCTNGERYDPIAGETLIEFDVVFDADEKNPTPGPWAPRQKPPQP